MKGWSRIPVSTMGSIFLLALLAPAAFATSMLPQNVVDLISLSERIMVGEVAQMSDGIDAQNVPYTEITVRVDESIRGDNGAFYTFRQYGLLEPRPLPNGTTNLQVSPPGWPSFRAGEQVMLFLYKEAKITGLQTSVGLFQGKFTIENGQIANALGNKNVFLDVDADLAAFDASQQKLFAQRGALPADDFISFVRAAVSERWVEQGRIRHAQ